MPYIIDVSVSNYKYKNTPHLSDSISSIVNISFSVGEAAGSLSAGLLVDFIGYKDSATLMACAIFVYTILFVISCGYFSKTKKVTEMGKEELMTTLDHTT